MTTMKLERIPSMRERVEDTLSAYRNDLVSLLSRFRLFSPIEFCRPVWVLVVSTGFLSAGS